MSSYDDWTHSTTVYDYARTQAKARALQQWNNWYNDPTTVNLWTTYNTVQRQNWSSPWFEKELGGFFNGPANPPTSPAAYEVTQNAYYIFCWMKYKGYSRYAIQAMLTVDWNECRMGHGSWEGNLCPYNFSNDPSSLIGFSANRIGESGTNYDNNWYHNRSIVPASVASAFDEVTHITYNKNRLAGSWAAYNRWDLQTYTDPDTGLERVTLVNGEPVFYVTPGTQYCVIGYGIVQWTNWTRLVRHARLCVPNYGGNHWQFNSTLQLMVLEWERQTAMATDPSDQNLPTYEGEWVNAYATRAFFTYNGTNYHYPYSCTWDNWASGGYLTWVEQKCADLGITGDYAIETIKRKMTIDILGRCYLHSSHYNTYFSNVNTQSLYFGDAIDYWDQTGWSILDVPRARDIPVTELDTLQRQERDKMFVFLSNPIRRRKRKRVCTILL